MADLKTGFLGPTRAAAVPNYYDSASGVRPLQDQEARRVLVVAIPARAIRGARCVERVRGGQRVVKSYGCNGAVSRRAVGRRVYY
jgi:hypothetical protein